MVEQARQGRLSLGRLPSLPLEQPHQPHHGPQQREALFRPLVQAAAQLLPTEEQGQQEQVGVGACVHEVAGSGAREAAWLPAGHGCQQAEARHLASLAGSSRR